MIDSHPNVDHRARDCLDATSTFPINIKRTIKILIAANYYLLKNLRDFGDIRFLKNVETDTLLLVDGCIHFLRGAPWWVTWCLLRYHLFFTFFWQISHWSSLPTVCIFKMCWNGTLNDSCPQRAVHAGRLCTCLRLNLLLNILWQYWHMRGCLDFQEGPSRAAIWSGPSKAAIWSAALVPSTLWGTRYLG